MTRAPLSVAHTKPSAVREWFPPPFSFSTLTGRIAQFQQVPAMPRPLLVSNVRLLDFAAGQFGPETSLLIEEGRIRWVGNAQDRELPQDIDTLDGGGRFVIPGLFDMHAHIQRDFQPTWLAYGVTSIRDLGGQISWVAALADRSAASAVPIPRIFFSGDILHGASTTRDPIMISSASEARAYARRWSVYGVHNLKTQ